MFILKRQDVEIVNVQNPQNRDQQIPILHYQGQTFRLLNMFGDNREEALALWRDLTDNRGKACVLLEEPNRFSVWGRVKLDRHHANAIAESGTDGSFIQACLLILQALCLEIEDLLGSRQSLLFKQDLLKVLQKGKFSQGDTASALDRLLEFDPLSSIQLPAWSDSQLQLLLGALYDLGKVYLGNTDFIIGAKEALNDMSDSDRKKVLEWLQSSPKGKLWC